MTAIKTTKIVLGVCCAVLALVALVLGLEVEWGDSPILPSDQRSSAAPTHEAAATLRQLEDIGVMERAIVDSPSRPNPLELRVQDASGMPIPEATVALVPDTRPLGVDQVAFRTTSADGIATIGIVTDRGERTWHVLVAATGRIPTWEPFVPPPEGGEVSVTLGESGRIQGVVRIAGRREDWGAERDELPRSLFLVGGSQNPLFDMPRGLQQRLRELGHVWLNKAQAPIDPNDGRFEFVGLPDGGGQRRIALPFHAPFVVHPAATRPGQASRNSIKVPVGTLDVEIVVVPVPAVRGRVVFDNGEPAAFAELSIRPWLVDDDGPQSFISAGPDGRFTHGLSINSIPHHRWLDAGNQPRVMRVDFLTVSHPFAASKPRFTYEFAANARWAEVGDIVIERLDRIHVLAADPSGKAIVGAIFAGDKRSTPTGTDGRTTVAVSDPARRTFRIGAPGWMVDQYEAIVGSGTAEYPLRFELAPTNRVTLRLISEQLSPDDVMLEVEGPKTLFHAHGGRRPGILPSRLHTQAGTSGFSSGGNRRGSTRSTRKARFEPNGTFTMCSVIPDRRLDIYVVDKGGQVLVEATATTPPFGESISLDLIPDSPICSIDGFVLSATGEPVKSAAVTVGNQHRRGSSLFTARARSDDAGKVRFRLRATGEIVPARIQAAGHALLQREIRLIEGAIAPTFHLQPGYEVRARVVDPSGAHIDAAVSVADRTLAAKVTRQGDGSTLIECLPGAPVELTTSYAGRTFSKRIDPASAEGPVAIEVPAPIRIPLRVATHVASDTVLTLSLQALDGNGRLYTQVHCVDGTWQPSMLAIYPGTYEVRCGVYAGSESWKTKWTISPKDNLARWLMR